MLFHRGGRIVRAVMKISRGGCQCGGGVIYAVPGIEFSPGTVLVREHAGAQDDRDFRYNMA